MLDACSLLLKRLTKDWKYSITRRSWCWVHYDESIVQNSHSNKTFMLGAIGVGQPCERKPKLIIAVPNMGRPRSPSPARTFANEFLAAAEGGKRGKRLNDINCGKAERPKRPPFANGLPSLSAVAVVADGAKGNNVQGHFHYSGKTKVILLSDNGRSNMGHCASSLSCCIPCLADALLHTDRLRCQ